jgi:hypothetical protein
MNKRLGNKERRIESIVARVVCLERVKLTRDDNENLARLRECFMLTNA